VIFIYLSFLIHSIKLCVTALNNLEQKLLKEYLHAEDSTDCEIEGLARERVELETLCCKFLVLTTQPTQLSDCNLFWVLKCTYLEMTKRSH